MPTRYFCGLDLGQSQDFSAFTVLERLTPVSIALPHYHVRHLERWPLGTRYPKIVADVKKRMTQAPLSASCELVVDQTGVGRPVLDLLIAEHLRPIGVTITGGDAVTHDGDEWRVPKRILVSVLQVLLQGGRLKVAESLPEAATLVREFLAFQVKIDLRTAHDSYGAWREGAHDDLVLAVALGGWYGERLEGQPVQVVSNIFYNGDPREWRGKPQLTFVNHDWPNCNLKPCDECSEEMELAAERGEIILSR